MGRIAYHTFAVSLPDYSIVLGLDRELIAWRDAVPNFFALINPDTSMDKQHPYLFVQRHLLASEWYYTRITLNRPYLLRRKPQDGRYTYSKKAAIESATADLLNRRAFVMAKGNLVVNSGGYRVLNSYMVLGVTIKLDPQSPQADELRHLLNLVSGRVPDAEGQISEPLVKEELAIVEFLTAKPHSSSKQQAAAGRQNRGNGNGEDQTPVDLLLGLAKTRSGRRAAEEEKRQLRLQQQRTEIEERQAQTVAGGQNTLNTGPWGYVAPAMPGLDVQQPFGENASRRVPRPLQPPPSRRATGDFTNPWPADLFASMSGQTPPSSGAQSKFDPMNPQPHQISHQPMQQLQPGQPLESSSLLPDQYSQFIDMGNITLTSPSVATFNTPMFFDQLNTDVSPFGQGTNGAFNFSDLGFGTGLTPQDVDNGSFNPFALAHNQVPDEG